jgi:hypothetical protein
MGETFSREKPCATSPATAHADFREFGTENRRKHADSMCGKSESFAPDLDFMRLEDCSQRYGVLAKIRAKCFVPTSGLPLRHVSVTEPSRFTTMLTR